LPFKAEDVMLVNLQDKIDAKMPQGLSQQEIESVLDDSTQSIFVYAGFLKPGKHDIIVYDQESGKLWQKSIVVDLRKGEIKSDTAQKQECTIEKYHTDEGVFVNLDHSLFRNFKRLLKHNIEQCIHNDTRFWTGTQIILDHIDYAKTINIIHCEFRTLGELQHILSAQLGAFPVIKVKDLAKVLQELKIPVLESQIIEQYALVRPECLKSSFEFSRSLLLELCLVMVNVLYIKTYFLPTYHQGL
jgi:hypothetical protein